MPILYYTKLNKGDTRDLSVATISPKITKLKIHASERIRNYNIIQNCNAYPVAIKRNINILTIAFKGVPLPGAPNPVNNIQLTIA